MRRVNIFRDDAAEGRGNVYAFGISDRLRQVREKKGAGFVRWQESQELGHGWRLEIRDWRLEIRDWKWSAKPEGETQEIGGESKDGEGRHGEQSPMSRGTQRQVAELENLEERKWQS